MPALQQLIDSRHYAELAANESEPPRWLRLLSLQLGTLCCIVANSNAPKGTSFKLQDFLPWQLAQQEQSVEDMMMICQALTLQHGGEIK